MNSPNQRHSNRRGSINVQAKSLEQALVKAAGQLGLTQDEMAHEVVKEESTKGFLSFFKSSSVEIKAWPKTTAGGEEPRRNGGRRDRNEDRPQRSTPRPRQAPMNRDIEDEDEASMTAREPLPPEKVEALKDELRDFCAGICGRITGEPVEVTAEIEEDRLVLGVQSEGMAEQINRNSKLAEAMEHILRKKPRHLRQELPFRIFVDVGGMRKKREAELVQMALDLSAKVHENKRPIVLNYKSSYDRKIIHMALDKDERVYTKSIGSGPNRKLMILPSRDAASGPPEQIDPV